ncbi:unnamed protein product [Mesocestoides corti]|uniref:Uncharacterized protein n=1 Tax=Mesocestoides corti TaxID=53468 RepID=A0A0R3U2C8_MESCO|nr:unnamed protein product [Mesocestoides corti]
MGSVFFIAGGYAGAPTPSGQLDLSVSTGSRSFQQAPTSAYVSDGGRFNYDEGDSTPSLPYYNPQRASAPLPPPLGMYDQNYRNSYQNNASMTAAAVAAAAYSYHYQQQQLQQQQQQQQLQQQQQQQQETDSPYDRVPYDYGRNRYLF